MRSHTLKPLENIAKFQDTFKVFLAGSMNTEWRAKFINDWNKLIVNNHNTPFITFIDPTRKDWDSSWKCVYSDPNFYQQKKWEMNAMRHSDIVIVNLSSGSQSPISLMEMCLHYDKVLLVRDDEFWKVGDVDVTCEDLGIRIFDKLEDIHTHLQLTLS